MADDSLDGILDLENYGQVVPLPDDAVGSIVTLVQLEKDNEIAAFMGAAVMMDRSTTVAEAIIQHLLTKARETYPGMKVKNYNSYIILK